MRYYFDIYDGDHWTRDDLGMDCRDDRAARYQAVLGLVELARDILPFDGAEKKLAIRVRSREDQAFTVRLEFDIDAGPALADRSIAGE